MGKTYSHLSAEERAAIMIEQSRQTSCRGIARLLGRSVSTVSRELSRNRTEQSEAYDATAAAKGYRARRERSVRHRKLGESSELYQRVRNLLIYRCWSDRKSVV